MGAGGREESRAEFYGEGLIRPCGLHLPVRTRSWLAVPMSSPTFLLCSSVAETPLCGCRPGVEQIPSRKRDTSKNWFWRQHMSFF